MADLALVELVKEFADCVFAQSKEKDAKVGNEYARRYTAAFETLRAVGDEGREALATLLADDRAEVRVVAASCLLRYCGARARAVLEKEAAGRGLLAFRAAQALQRWDEGTWHLDPADSP